jgi:hypothetical protein
MVCHSFMFGPVFSIFVLRIGVGKHTIYHMELVRARVMSFLRAGV